MSDAHLFAIGVVLAWLAGIRVYLTVFGVGLAGAFAISRLLQGLLFGVPTLNVMGILGVCLLLLVVAFGACSCPLPQGLDRLRRCAAPLGDQAGFPALPSLRSVQGG